MRVHLESPPSSGPGLRRPAHSGPGLIALTQPTTTVNQALQQTFQVHGCTRSPQARFAQGSPTRSSRVKAWHARCYCEGRCSIPLGTAPVNIDSSSPPKYVCFGRPTSQNLISQILDRFPGYSTARVARGQTGTLSKVGEMSRRIRGSNPPGPIPFDRVNGPSQCTDRPVTTADP